MRTYKLTIEDKELLFKQNNISVLKLTFEVKNISDENFLELIKALKEEQRHEAIKLLSNRRQYDKSSLHYIIQILNHSDYFYSYIEWYSRNEWLEKLIKEVNTEKGLNKLLELNTFKHLKSC